MSTSSTSSESGSSRSSTSSAVSGSSTSSEILSHSSTSSEIESHSSSSSNYGRNDLWVCGGAAETSELKQYSHDDYHLIRTLDTGDKPFSIAICPVTGDIWTANFNDDSVSRFDVSNNYNRTDYTVGDKPWCVAIDSQGNVFTANNGDNDVSMLDASNNFSRTDYAVGSQPRDLAIDGNDDVWTANFNDDDVSHLDSSDGYSRTDHDAGNGPRGICVDSNNNIWVSNHYDQDVTFLDASDSYNRTDYPVGRVMVHICVDLNDSIWGGDYSSGDAIFLDSSDSYNVTIYDICDVNNTEYVCCDNEGNVFCTNFSDHTIGRFDTNNGNAYTVVVADTGFIPRGIASRPLSYTINSSSSSSEGYSSSSSSSSGEPVQQMLMGGTVGATSGRYCALGFGAASSQTTRTYREHPMCYDGTLKNFYVHAYNGAPGVGNSVTFTIYKNGVATDLTVTIADNDTEGNDTAHTASFSQGDYLTVYYEESGSISNDDFLWSMVMAPSDLDNKTMMMCSSVPQDARYTCPFAHCSNNAAADPRTQISALDGTISNLRGRIAVAPGLGETSKMTLYVNDVASSVSVTFSDDETEQTDNNSVVVSRGDRLYFYMEVSGGAAAGTVGTFSFEFEPDKYGRFMANSLNYTSGTDYIYPTTYATNGFANEASALMPSADSVRILSSTVRLHDSPGAGTGYTHTFRIAETDTTDVITISDTDTYGTWDGEVSASAGEYLSIRIDEVGAATTRYHYIAHEMRIFGESQSSESSSSSQSEAPSTSSSTSSESSSTSSESSSTSSESSSTSSLEFSSSSSTSSSESTPSSESTQSSSTSSSESTPSSESTQSSSTSSSESTPSSESSSTSSESTQSSSSSSLPEVGWTWGYATPVGTTAEEWTTWKYKESPTEARNSGDWGELELNASNEFVSPVKDTGGNRNKRITITFDDYDTGHGGGSIEWRGSATSFNQQDDEVVGPVWQAYTVPFFTTLRYLQVKTECS